MLCRFFYLKMSHHSMGQNECQAICDADFKCFGYSLVDVPITGDARPRNATLENFAYLRGFCELISNVPLRLMAELQRGSDKHRENIGFPELYEPRKMQRQSQERDCAITLGVDFTQALHRFPQRRSESWGLHAAGTTEVF